MKIINENTFLSLPADESLENIPRQVYNACYSLVRPQDFKNRKLIHYSDEMLSELEIDNENMLTDLFTGDSNFIKTPYAMCYGGHQFGHWAGQLGDGRAINILDVAGKNDKWTLQLKGAGPTPYSRRADGYAVLRSSIREHLCSEAMFALGVPTTRSLALFLSGKKVLRDMLYDGNPAFEDGAIVCRVSPSFIRFGNFQILYAQNDGETLKKLLDYTIANHFKEINDEENKYELFLEKVFDLTLEMILHWQRVGFVHGVMNTDNMSILGLTIDYGPYGWLEDYNAKWTPNTTDSEFKRYAFGNQPQIALWNLAQLAAALSGFVREEKIEELIEKYKSDFGIKFSLMMFKKLGIVEKLPVYNELIGNLLTNLSKVEIDYTIFFRELSKFSTETLINTKNFTEIMGKAFYDESQIEKEFLSVWQKWLVEYQNVLINQSVSHSEKKKNMDSINPKFVLRNYMAQLAIDKADEKDYKLIAELSHILKKPYDEQPQYEKWYAKRPQWAKDKVGCSKLSCSS